MNSKEQEQYRAQQTQEAHGAMKMLVTFVVIPIGTVIGGLMIAGIFFGLEWWHG